MNFQMPTQSLQRNMDPPTTQALSWTNMTVSSEGPLGGSDTKVYPLAVILPLLSIMSSILAIPPLILNAKNRNFPAAVLIFWCLILNWFNILNAFLWPSDDVNSWWDGTGLCDIEVKIMAAGYVAVPGALLCIFRSLANVLDTSNAFLVPSRAQRWRNRFTEVLFCAIVPVLAMVAHIFWQKDRYMLFAISGCVNNFDESWISLVLEWIWPPMVCFIAAYYCCLVIARIRKYRHDFELILHSANSSMSKSRFLRLFLAAFTMLVAITPLQIYVFYMDIKLSLPWHPYSWHGGDELNWKSIPRVKTRGSVFFDRWTPVAMGFIIFAFCGFGRDAVNFYRAGLRRLGLGYCFPTLVHPLDSQASHSAPTTAGGTTLVGSTRDRVRQIFKWRMCSDADLEKGTAPGASAAKESKFAWLRVLFRRPKVVRPERGFLIRNLTVPVQTVATSAWADSSRRSQDGSALDSPRVVAMKDSSIHVRQVISQQCEMQTATTE
ncbi:hypothetical protein N7468_007981 [Penicillium chermesinum]|uniref:A-pheromone receptor PreA n=1 Tax=Penicillium chermesinum TaxID=63820 RepID=A0A9W9NNX3_9EURO|nr:uncharacterized protein N7468_007981 [Penicillium chermesinum]KAJ5223439.1 hypothetical protein N7468_007981 [Penicillium chermesinum]